MARAPRKSKQQIATGVETAPATAETPAVAAATPTVTGSADPATTPEVPAATLPEEKPAEKTSKPPTIPVIAVSRVKNAINSGLLNAAISNMSKTIKLSIAEKTQELVSSSPLVTSLKAQQAALADQLAALPVGDPRGETLTAQVKSLQTQIAAETLKLTDASPQIGMLKTQGTALSKSKVRFSSDCPRALAAAATVLTRALIAKAMAEAIAKKVKTTSVAHLYAEDFENFEYYCLLQGLPAFEAERKHQELQKTQENLNSMIKSRLSLAEKDFKRKYGVKKAKADSLAGATTTGSTTSTTVTTAPATEPASDEKDDGVSFNFYISAISRDSELFPGDRRTSKKFLAHVSQIILQFVQRTAVWSNHITCCMANKTISEKIILEVLKMKMLENEPFTEKITISTENVPATETSDATVHHVATRVPVYSTKTHEKFFAEVAQVADHFYPEKPKKSVEESK